MADRLAGITTRLYSDYIVPPKIIISAKTHNKTANEQTAAQLGWNPIRLEYTNGVNPSVMMFKLEFLDGNTGERQYADAANFEGTIKYFRPSTTTRVQRTGFSKIGNISALSPMTEEQQIAFKARVQHRLSIPEQLAYVDIYDDSTASGRLYLGRFWLSNISVEKFDSIILTFADARYRCYEKPIIGRWVENTQQYVFAPHLQCIFNPNGDGNMADVISSQPTNRWFVEDWRGSQPLDPTKAKKWSCWDMILYLWHHQYAYEIEQPTDNDPSWAVWKKFAGFKTPTVDVSGMNGAEAIDAVMRASGDFSYTLIPQVKDKRWRCRPYHLVRYRTYDQPQGSESSIDYREYNRSMRSIDNAEPAKYIVLPDRGAKLDGHRVNVGDISLDEQSTARIGHLVLVGDPIIIESTFSTNGAYDLSCMPANSSTGSSVATLEYAGDLSAFQTAYNAAIGAGKSRKLALLDAQAADDVAYKVVSLKRGITSAINSQAGYGFAPSDGTFSWERRPFLPYRLPKPTGTANDPTEANEKPEILVWFKKNTDADWKLAGSPQDGVTGGYSIDPVTGGIRFKNPMIYDYAGWTAYDIMVTACIELDERLMCEAYHLDYLGKSYYEQTHGKYRMGIRWNSMDIDATTVTSEIPIDDRDELSDECIARFGQLDRTRASARIEIPWAEYYYTVGDWIGEIRSGVTQSYNPKPSARSVDMPIVGVVIDYQGMTTEIRTENWRQG